MFIRLHLDYAHMYMINLIMVQKAKLYCKIKNKLTPAYLNSYLYNNNTNPAYSTKSSQIIALGHHQMKLLEHSHAELTL